MQQFPCPFCGLRNETEFHFAGEAGKTRPNTLGQVSAEQWNAYLNHNANPMGNSREVWVHLPCQEYFVMQRDTVTMDVLGIEQLRRDAK